VKAVVIARNGGPEVLEVRDEPEPTPGEDEVLVEVDAIGVNFRDIYEREGGFDLSSPPTIIGAEGAGRLADSGKRVAWVDVPRTYAERVAPPRDRLVEIPDGVTSEIAAAVALQGATAHYLSGESYPVQPGDWVIVHAAAGGVGHLLTQLVRLRGGRVLATTSTDKKAELVRKAGADEVTTYDAFAERARELTEGEGVAAVYDGVGRATFDGGLKALRPFGKMILYGAASGHPDPMPLVQLAAAGSLYVQWATLVTYIRRPDELRRRVGEVLDLVQRGELAVHIGGRYPLEEARRAHEDLGQRRSTGKLLLLP
jgi:NADPH2:quinone reductase